MAIEPLPPCPEDIYRNGKPIARLHTARALDMEAFCIELRKHAPGIRVDWYYVGGIANFDALPTDFDEDVMHKAFVAAWPVYLEAYARRMAELNMSPKDYPPPEPSLLHPKDEHGIRRPLENSDGIQGNIVRF